MDRMESPLFSYFLQVDNFDEAAVLHGRTWHRVELQELVKSTADLTEMEESP